MELLQSADERVFVAAGREQCSLLPNSGLDCVFQPACLGHAPVTLRHSAESLVPYEVDDAGRSNVRVRSRRLDLKGKTGGRFTKRLCLFGCDTFAHVCGFHPRTQLSPIDQDAFGFRGLRYHPRHANSLGPLPEEHEDLLSNCAAHALGDAGRRGCH
ncbi:hypothetical protein FOE78_05235 [Microlunatus elymi]|uniref:Uncharacterized protein n=1 Tax=Microlunatus elymi TaxID=2596828 RepID=A0A516PW35_9ACTN|nr:hypothetical protein FOE78_05235 [Microlunatus elymi]